MKKEITSKKEATNSFSLSTLTTRPLCAENIAALHAFKNTLILKAYSPNTVKTYTTEFHVLLRVLSNMPAHQLSSDQVKLYVLWLITKKGYGEAQTHSAINAIKFYYEQVLHRSQMLFQLPRPKKAEQLPKVHDGSIIEKMLRSTSNTKHKTMLMLAYSTGIRLSEIINLELTDIDSARMVVLVRRGKGKKDRHTVLSPLMLQQLRTYYKMYKPKKYLFEGADGGQYGYRSVQEVFKQAKERVGIKIPGGIHTLRHSFATHLMETGTDIRIIQELLGHSKLETTMRYTHVSSAQIQKVTSPLDHLSL
jgi:integrase/recombinase XerD